MVKILHRSDNKKNYFYVYDSANYEEANYIGIFNDNGKELPNRDVKNEKKPVEYLWAKSNGKRYSIAKDDRHIEAIEMQLADGRVGYWFTME